MNHKLTPGTVLMLVVPPLLWAGNAVVGRAVADLIPPITLNFVRWVLAFLMLLPFGWRVFRPGSGLWRRRRLYAVLGLLGVGVYNSMQYLALHTSTPINVTLVGASMPVWMLVVGRLFFQSVIAPRQLLGAALSIAGVAIVLAQGQLAQLLQFRFVIGDIYMLTATIVWSVYSWLLTRTTDHGRLRSHWAQFLMAQLAFGVVWSGVFAGVEWSFTPAAIHWGWPLAAVLLYVSIGPAIIAFRCWGAGVQRAGPATAGFFNNLTPLFAAVMSTAFLGDLPQAYHALAFALIVSGIVLSSGRR